MFYLRGKGGRSLLIDDLGDVPHGLVDLEVVLGLLGGALQPGVSLGVLCARQEAWLLEAVRHLNREAVVLLGRVQCEHEAFVIVPLWVGGVAPLHELVHVEGNLTAGHKSSLADLLANLEISTNHETEFGQDELEGGRSVLALNLWILRWLLWNIDECLAVQVKSIGRLELVVLVLIPVVVVVPEGVLEVLVAAVHLETDALVDKHLVLALPRQLEALVREDDVLPDLRDLDLLHLQEFLRVEIFIPLNTVVFAQLEGEQEELVRVLHQIIQYIDDLESHLLHLNQFSVGLDSLVVNLINLVLRLDQGLQELRDLSAFEGVVHLGELIKLEFLQFIELIVSLS